MHNIPSPWHAGERRLQALVGAEEQMRDVGRRVIRDYMPDQHRELFARLPFIVLGSVDPEGRPWATLLAGTPGFVHSPDPRSLHVHQAADPHDPAWRGIQAGAAVGVLGIELATRRRNRMNGTISDLWARRGFQIQVDQSFGNCPRYIHPRDLDLVPGTSAAAHVTPTLDAAARMQIERADTLFVATYVDAAGEPPRRQVDVSHRGGAPGFVHVSDDGTLTIPDYAGNRFFATLGNLMENPRAGMLFVDFQTGAVLQLSGRAELFLDGPTIGAFPGAERVWTLTPDQVVRRQGALSVRHNQHE